MSTSMGSFTSLFDDVFSSRWIFPCGKVLKDEKEANEFQKKIAESKVYEAFYGTTKPDFVPGIYSDLVRFAEAESALSKVVISDNNWTGGTFEVPDLGDDDDNLD